jgi:hypothetical protein
MPVRLVGAGIGTVLYARDYEQYRIRLRAANVTVLDHLWLGNVSLRRADAQLVGLRSARFSASYHADRELGFRLRQAGLTGVFDESIVAVHHHVRPDSAFVRDALRRGAGVAMLHELHPETMGPFELEELVAGVPRPWRGLARRIGASSGAPVAARVLLGMGRVCRALHWGAGEVAAAQVARRMLFCRGAVAGEP